MVKLDSLKMVLYDFDDTLCIHNNHTLYESSLHRHNVSVIRKGVGAWDNASVSSHMKEFMELCESYGIRQGLMSATSPYHSLHKCEWVEHSYGIELENFCVSSSEDKSSTMCVIADAYDYKHNQMIIIDDYWKVLTSASNEGFQAYSPMQIVNYIESLKEKL